MSYNRYNNSYDYGSDSDDDVPPPPPPPPARYGYSTDSGPVDYTPPAQYGFPQPPPSLQPGGGRYSTPPPGSSSYRASPPPSTYHSPPPTGGYQSPPSTYRSPPASTYREPTPPNYHGSTPPSYNQPPLSNYSPSLSSYNQVPRDSYSQVPPPPPPPKGAYRGGSPASGGYRASPPPSARGSQPPSAYSGSPQLYTSSALKRTESYTEDYSAYGISAAAARTQTGGYNTGDDAPPAFDRRKTEHMALTIATNVKRDEESISAKFGDLVSSSAEKLTKAQDVVEKVIQNDTYKLAKDQVEAIFSPAKDVIAFLDVIKSIHPVVGTVTTIFTALIKLEVDRRENDRSIAVLHLAMTNLLFILSCLEPTFATPDKMQTMLQKYLEDVCRTMNAFGNFCDVYYKHGSIVRMIRSHGYKTKLAGYGTSFEDHKKELQYLMTTKTAGTVTQMNSNVQNISMQLNQVLAFINQQSPKEKAIVKKIQEYPGGEDEAVKDDKLLAKISKLAKENITSQIKYALRENIDDAIKSNFALFSLKVETAMNEIKDAVARSTDTIMARLDSGPHDLITDEDIKTVWKQMNWRLSCKCRHFVDAVHHHYAQVFGKYTLETGEPHPEHWTLTFLSNIIFYPAIGDAIDEDGSGYLSVHEVDRFFNSRPTGWTPTQWMAYWAAGWYVNAVGYRHRIIAMMNSIKEASEKILPQNKSLLRPYLKKGCYGKIMLMIEGLYTDNLQYHGQGTGDEYEALNKYRRERMDEELTRMKAHLAKPNYELDSNEAVLAVLGTPRVEVTVLPLLYLVLRRHKKIIDFASHLVLDEMEFYTMVECIKYIAKTFETRFRNLLESWRQQRLDTKLQIACFSGGIFEAWHEEFHAEEAEPDSDWDSDALGSSEDEEVQAAKRDAQAVDASDPKKARDILLYPLPPQPTRADTRKLRQELEEKKAKKEAKKKAKREAALALSDSDDDVGVGYTKKTAKTPASSSYNYDSDEGSGYNITSGYGDVSDSDSDSYDYEDPKLWDSDEDSDSGNSSDSSASDFMTRTAKKPKIDERITDLEDQLLDMQVLLKEILSLTKKNFSNR